MVTEKLLNKLKENQATFALDALKRPQQRDVFEYGNRVGMVAGFEEAINVLLTLLDEEKYSDKGL